MATVTACTHAPRVRFCAQCARSRPCTRHSVYPLRVQNLLSYSCLRVRSLLWLASFAHATLLRNHCVCGSEPLSVYRRLRALCAHSA
ncbi:hypothetical protein EXIGLDRAFT_508733 [Exidia glandulosa HHB12029]|uniref:Uncharacterized protein n=1 Tax=Exidia glandulosa HHB12029 TaxID=1314781 RepID=A0A165PCW9_EXIGL|nr:hypothetical protein EXIGLDRAFT_508733 [Exidia glandulosa HHB12029]